MAATTRPTSPSTSSSCSTDAAAQRGSVHLNPAELIDLLQRQQGLYQQLERLSRAQEAEINEGSMEAVLAVLSQRQEVIDQLGRVHEQLEPYRQRWESFWLGLEEDWRQQAGELVAQCKELLASIIERDERHRKQLQESRTSTGRELGRLSTGGAAVQAYGAPPPAGSQFTDRQG